MQLALNLPNPLAARQSLFTDHGKALTTSRAVAAHFGKRHDNVVRDIQKLISELDILDSSLLKIEELDCQNNQFSRLNFQPSDYKNSRGKNFVEYRLTYDAFALLTMGFTGRDALAWKFAFIQAFNALEAELLAHVTREAAALHQLRPLLAPVVADATQGLSRSVTGLRVQRSAASISYHRRVARNLGLLPTRRLLSNADQLAA